MSSADRSASPPSPVLRLVDGAVGWFAAVAAVDLGLFAALADAPDGLDISSLAARCNAPAERVETLCQRSEERRVGQEWVSSVTLGGPRIIQKKNNLTQKSSNNSI